MKKNRKISFGLLIALSVLLCFGIDPYAHSDIRSFTVEMSSGSENLENCFCSDIDSFNHDQNSQVAESCSLADYLIQMPTPRNLFLINKFFLSVWQPPKIS